VGVRLIIQSRLVFFCCIPYFENRLCFHFSFLTRHSSFFISHSFLRLLVALPLLRHPVFVIYTKWEGDILLIPLSLHFPYSSYNFQTQTSNPSNFKPFKPQTSFFISHSFLRLLVALPLLRHPVFVIYTKWEGDILLIPLSLHFPYSSYNFQTQTSNPSNFKLSNPSNFKPQTPNLFLHFSLISAFIIRTPTSKTSCFCNLYQVGGRHTFHSSSLIFSLFFL